MSGQDATAAYLEFLRQRDAVSHIVSAPHGSNVSALALTQRCLASGVEFPVPLPDGSVAFRVDGEVPPALAALDLTIEAFPPADEPEAPASDPDNSESIVGASHDDGEFSSADSDSEAVEGLVASGETGQVADNTETASDEQQSFPDAQPSCEPGVDARMDGPEGAEAVADPEHVGADVVAEPSLPDGNCDDAAPIFVASPRGPVATEVPANQPTSASPCDETETSEVVQDAGDIAQEIEAESMQEHLPGEQTDHAASLEAPEVNSDSADRIERIEAMLTKLEDRFAAMESGQAGLAESVESISCALDDAVSRPPVRPDVTDFNRGMARIMTALSHAVRRIEDVLDVSAAGSGQDSGSIAASLATGLAALADAVRAMQNEHGPSAELAVIASMQKTLSHQLAKLLEASQAQRAPMMEEFLMDIRHATAELLAEQARVAQAK